MSNKFTVLPNNPELNIESLLGNRITDEMLKKNRASALSAVPRQGQRASNQLPSLTSTTGKFGMQRPSIISRYVPTAMLNSKAENSQMCEIQDSPSTASTKKIRPTRIPIKLPVRIQKLPNVTNTLNVGREISQLEGERITKSIQQSKVDKYKLVHEINSDMPSSSAKKSDQEISQLNYVKKEKDVSRVPRSYSPMKKNVHTCDTLELITLNSKVSDSNKNVNDSIKRNSRSWTGKCTNYAEQKDSSALDLPKNVPYSNIKRYSTDCVVKTIKGTPNVLKSTPPQKKDVLAPVLNQRKDGWLDLPSSSIDTAVGKRLPLLPTPFASKTLNARQLMKNSYLYQYSNKLRLMDQSKMINRKRQMRNCVHLPLTPTKPGCPSLAASGVPSRPTPTKAPNLLGNPPSTDFFSK